jgi:hypothetical protein
MGESKLLRVVAVVVVGVGGSLAVIHLKRADGEKQLTEVALPATMAHNSLVRIGVRYGFIEATRCLLLDAAGVNSLMVAGS